MRKEEVMEEEVKNTNPEKENNTSNNVTPEVGDNKTLNDVNSETETDKASNDAKVPNGTANGTETEDDKDKIPADSKDKVANATKKNAGIVVLCILAVIALVVGLVSCNKTSEAEIDYALIQNTKTLDFSKEGKKVNPIELVTIYRVTDSQDAKQTSSEKKETDKGLAITCKPTSIDTGKTGSTKVEFTVKDTEHKDATKTLTATFKVIDSSKTTSTTSDTSAIRISDKKQELTVGDKFDVKKVVSDAGDYKLVDKAPAKNADGTYDTAWYTLTSNVDTTKAGTYEVTIHYVDKDGNEADKKVTVTVKEKSDKETKDSSKDDKTSEKADSDSSANKSASGGTNTQPSQNNAPAASKQPSGGSSSNSGSAGTNNNASNSSAGTNGGGGATCTKKQVQTKAAWSEQVLVTPAYDETVTDQEAYDETVRVADVIVCHCGQQFNSMTEWRNHRDSIYAETGDNSHGGYSVDGKYETVHHDAVTHVEHHDAVYTTVDHPAEYTEVCN